MKHYKIVKKTEYSLCASDGFKEDVQYLTYRRKFFIFWLRIKSCLPHSDGKGNCHFLQTFRNEEDALDYINSYHKNKHDIGKYKIETVRYIKL